MQTPPHASPEEIARELHSVLSGSEFHHDESLLEGFFDWLASRLGSLDPGHAGAVGRALMVVFLALLFLLVLRLAWRLRGAAPSRRARRGGALSGGEPSVRARVRDLRLAARRAREEGDLRLALRLAFFALVVGMGERGDVEYRDAWTNRELLRRGRPEPAARSILEPLVGELEAKEFGREPVGPGDVDRLESLCELVLGELAGGAA